MRRFALAALVLLCVCRPATAACAQPEFHDHQVRMFSDIAERAAKEILSGELFGHYDLTTLSVLRVEGLRERLAHEPDYGLVKVVLAFSSRRNATRNPSLNPGLFEPGKCWGWLYLHCGVPVGHVFEGKLQLLLAGDGHGEWRVVSPNWRSRRQYSLHGYLLLDGRKAEGYVLFPAP